MKFTFLLLALGPLLLPLVFHLDKKIFKNDNFKAAFGASLVSAIIFSALTVVLQIFGIITFATDSTLGVVFKDVPLEQYLHNFSFSFASVSVYQYLNIKFPANNLQKYSLALSNLLMGLCVAFLFFGYPKWYTLGTFGTLLILLFLIEYVGTLRFMYRAYRAFAFILAPFCLVYGLLFWNGLVVVAKQQVTGMHLAKIPVENLFIALSMLLVSVYMFEFLKSKKLA
ncbi:lycopene cyclase domain-containing protein [Pedobacter sp. SL55]|uniref:lycopene cyclase domain-containing protein n=1 Tax=Pedobacter sp. SL55 TaxID=2995161 RepID=UPI00226D92E1|nr:lycopene cyclase domain-containing protein [Pedobacter sp. SL55]WAC41083.1 lycopene cyclase domain-containing protein [Pedobacter sp. SL55]